MISRPVSERGESMRACTHLDRVHITELPESVEGCEDRLAIFTELPRRLILGN